MIFSSKLRNILILLVLYILCIPAPVMADTVNYAYDNAYRLVSEFYEDGSSIYYSYDEVGNRTSKVISAPLTITAIAGSGGTITPSGNIIVPYGSDQVYQIEAFETGIIEDVLVDGISVGPVTSYTFPGVTAAHVIEARFLDCGVSVSPETAVFPQSGGTENVAISMLNSCPWQATSNSPWITITSVADGTGSGNLSFSVPENSYIIQRAGTITVAGKKVSIVQSAASSMTKPDETFSSPDATTIYNGPSSMYNWANGMAIQPDGRIIVVGASADDMRSTLLVLRYNPDGSLDNTFGINGSVFYSEGNSNYGNKVIVQPDGRIVVVGADMSEAASSVLVLRYNPDGTPDGSFGSNGAVAYTDGNWAFGNDVLVEPNGKILVLGTNYVYGSVASEALLMRLNPDGSPDNTFGSNGMVSYSGSLGAEGRAMTLQSDGKIVISGLRLNGMSSSSLLIRYNTDGTMDDTFGINGTVAYTDGSWDYGVAVGIQPDGKIIVTASSSYGTGHMLLMRYDVYGNPDNTFGTDGISGYTNESGLSVWPAAMSIQPDGRLIVAGAISNDLWLARFNTDGSLDSTFGAAGTLLYNDTVDGYLGGYAMDLQPDGKIVVAGERADGSLDSIFIIRLTDVRYSLSVAKTGNGHGAIRSYEADPAIDCGTTCRASYLPEARPLLKAIPDEGSHFIGWSGGGCTGTGDCYLTMDGDKSVSAEFDINSYTITSEAGVHGEINPSGAISLAHGANQTFSISTDAGYEIADVIVDGLSVGAIGSYAFADVRAPHNISVTFRAVSMDLTVSVVTDKGRQLSGIKVYVFKSSGTYTGTILTTGADGTVLLKADAFAQGLYKFRADYMGYQFWSETINLPGNGTVSVLITEEKTTVTLSPPISGTKVYLFSGAGAYLGISGAADAQGSISFDLPVGKAFKFRADNLGYQYWSSVTTISAGSQNSVEINLGGGVLALTVQNGPGSVMSGLKTYLFSKTGAYLGISQTTGQNGMVRYSVSSGDYRIRVDYLGYQFWTPDLRINTDFAMTFEITHRPVTFTVNSSFRGTDTPVSGQKVYLFNTAGLSLNISKDTDEYGRVVFDLPQKEFKVRTDYLGGQYWSAGSTWLDTVVNIPSADAVITVTGNGVPLSGAQVYVYTQTGSYLNLSGKTDANGIVVFRMPSGQYKFRADYQAKQFWSAEESIIADESKQIAISTGGGTFKFGLMAGTDAPLSGVKCYVFNEGGPYLNMSGVTNEQGEVTFGLADGNYQMRVDYLGYQFWTGVLTVPQTLNSTLLIGHENVTVTVQEQMSSGIYPVAGVKTYLFSPSGAYLGISKDSDANGMVNFNLPQKDYVIRVDYLGQQFWSDPFSRQDITVSIPEGIARVHVKMTGKDIAGNAVYVYNSADSYLGINGVTDQSGFVDFRLPAGSYKFRADYQGHQYKVSADVEQDSINVVDIASLGAELRLNVGTGNVPLPGVNVYVFSSAGSYLGISNATDENGQCVFSLADGGFRIRVDYLGYQYWTDTFAIPNDTNINLTIPHRGSVVTVQGVFGPDVTPLANLPLYLFTPSGSYQGRTMTTDINGQAYFTLPDAEYKIRADYLGLNIWSDTYRFTDPVITINEGAVRLHIVRDGSPIADARVYLFSDTGSYLGRFAVTDPAGTVDFLLPEHSYNFRIDEGIERCWSGLIDVAAGQTGEFSIDLNRCGP